MILDENGKLFGIISLLDLAVLLFLVFAVGASIYKASTMPEEPTSMQTANAGVQTNQKR